jgi:FlaA1/EpsC-like NDP-sugar epimerase
MYRKNGDLRTPLITKIRQGTLLNWIRVALLVLLDGLMLSLAWVIATQFGTPVEGFNLLWKNEQQPGFLLTILAITLGILAASGLYGTDDKRRSFVGLLKSLTLAQIILLITLYLYQPRIWLSRSVFLWAWLLSLIFVSVERLMLHLAVVSLRRKHVALSNQFFSWATRRILSKQKNY